MAQTTVTVSQVRGLGARLKEIEGRPSKLEKKQKNSRKK